MSTGDVNFLGLRFFRNVWSKRGFVAWVVLLLAVYYLYGFGGATPTTDPGPGQVASLPVAPDVQLPAEQRKPETQATTPVRQPSPSVSDSEQAVARAQLAGMKTEVTSIRDRLGKLKSLDADWQAKRASLLTGDAGRRIVTSPAHLTLVFQMLDREPPVTSDEILKWDVQIEELATPIEKALAAGTSTLTLTPDHERMLTDLGRRITAAVAALEQRQRQVAAILKETSGTTPGTQTLEEALAAHQVALAIQENEAHSRLLAEERAKTARMVRDTEIENERQLRDATEAAMKANAEIERKKVEDAAALARQQEQQRQMEHQARIQREQLEAKFQRTLPEIRRVLVPFITPGNRQIGKGEWTYTEEQKPLSLAAIRSRGALENSRSGYRSFYHITSGQQNDRPNGIFRGNYIGADVESQSVPDIVRAQNLLLEFGDLLVEKKLLEP